MDAIKRLGCRYVSIIFYGKTLDQAVDLTNYLAMGIAAVLLINDIVKKRSYIPFAIVLAVVGFTELVWELRNTPIWQAIGEVISKLYQ